MGTAKLLKNPESLMNPTSQEKAPLLQQIQDADLTKVAIFSGAGVDPDGLASQATIAAILEAWGHESHSFYRGSFNRPQNRTFRQVLGLSPKNEETFDPEDGWTCIISVDGPESVCPAEPHFIIDHHTEQGKPALIGGDIRLIGSASAILWEYAIAAKIDFESEAGSKLATALAIGIITDTKVGSTDTSAELDYEALAFCLKHKDNKLYKEIINFPQPAYYNDLFVKGWNNRTEEGTVLVTGLGNIPPSRGGVISDIAEKFSMTDTVSTAIVFAIVDQPNGAEIDISVRSSNSALDVDEFVKKAFGGGGGRFGMGRVTIPLPSIFGDIQESLSDKLSETVNLIVKHKALQFAGDKK
jgi:nanoRNase/pAp phosphatase (c-di-AMP/oligoRNAs hydrolase)